MTSSDLSTGRILDAARDLFTDVGIRRTTLEDIARRAGVDRVTVYRRLGSKSDVVVAVSNREARRAFDEVFLVADKADTAADRVAIVFARIVHLLWTHPLFNRLLKLEPDTALPKMTTEAGSAMSLAISGLVELLDKAVDDGLLARADDLRARAEIVVRLAHSFIVTPRADLALSTEADLLEFAHAHIVPIVTGAG
ncbi:TetR/AcrR family transcriptional regulator [Actinokineospora sp.]|uniref:TetR/AcrR family transcriptional regulator n=1 Tax=Actinokineospora sp. TaxID=1872133 RepID=UPI003D6A5516